MADNIFIDIASTIFESVVRDGGLETEATVITIINTVYNETTAEIVPETQELTVGGFLTGIVDARTTELSEFTYERKFLYLFKEYNDPKLEDVYIINEEMYNVQRVEIDSAFAVATIYLTKISVT